MSADLIDGKAFAERLRADIQRRVGLLKSRHGLTPGLAVILVGDDPASRIYVRNKGRQTIEAGMHSEEIRLPAGASGADILSHLHRLNEDRAIHGILVQLPLPSQIDARSVIAAIAPDKDVDGFHPMNVGRLAIGQEGFVPSTPKGCMMLLVDRLGELDGRDALVIGRSNIVGKPLAQLLLNANCTVTMAHSKSRDLPALCRRADILIAAVGKPELVRGGWVKPGAVVIDVGVNRVPAPEGKTRLVGDVAFNEARDVASAITPVPGGVGPMTIACLLENTLEAACRQAGVSMPN